MNTYAVSESTNECFNEYTIPVDVRCREITIVSQNEGKVERLSHTTLTVESMRKVTQRH